MKRHNQGDNALLCFVLRTNRQTTSLSSISLFSMQLNGPGIPANLAEIRAMTFNVRGCFHRQDIVNVWQNRKELNLMTIEKCNPDIIAFQEVQAGNFDAYNSIACYDHVVGHACKRSMHWRLDELNDRWQTSTSMGQGLWNAYHYIANNVGSSSQHDEYVPIYWKRKRFECLDSGAFYLSETPGVESIGWESKLIRAATWVCLKENMTGIQFLVVNTHFPHERHEATRTECARVLLQELDQIDTDEIPLILLGDFNCHASFRTEAYKLLLENGYQDTYCTSGKPLVNTFHHFLGDECPWSLGRIDWILTKDFNAGLGLHHARPTVVVREAQPPIYPSDHYPIIADLLLRRCNKSNNI